MSIKTRWVGSEGAAFERVGLAFESLGYRAPRPDTNSDGAYVSNIAAQYVADFSEAEAIAIIRWALGSSRELIRNRYMSKREIISHYAD